MIVYAVYGNDDDGNNDLILYKDKSKAIEELNQVAEDLLGWCYEEEDIEYRKEDAFRFDNGSNHWTEMWIEETNIIE